MVAVGVGVAVGVVVAVGVAVGVVVAVGVGVGVVVGVAVGVGVAVVVGVAVGVALAAMKKKSSKEKQFGVVNPTITAPTAPPKIVDWDVYKVAWEAERERVFPLWKAALEAADGNVTAASVAFFPEMDGRENRQAARDKGNRLTRRLGLVDFAKELRLAATGHARGRQDR